MGQGKVQLLIFELLQHPFLYLFVRFAACPDGLLVDFKRVLAVKLREEGQPAQPHGQGVHISGVVVFRALLRIHSPLGVQGHPVVAPLAGVEIPQGSGVHQAGRAGPVSGAAQIFEGGMQPGVLGAHVVVEVTPVTAMAAAEAQHHRHTAVVHGSAVIPVLDTRPGDNQGLALGLLGVLGELPGHLDDEIATDPCNRFLPGGGKGLGVVVVLGIVPF